MIDVIGIIAIEKLNLQVRDLKQQLEKRNYAKKNLKIKRMEDLKLILKVCLNGVSVKYLAAQLDTSEKTICRYISELREIYNLVDIRIAANKPSLYKII